MILSKSDKKVYRKLLDIAIEKEKTNYINDVINTIDQYKNNQLDFKETYHQIYKKVIENDKRVARRYDNISGAHYFDKILEFYANRLISEEEIKELSEPVREKLIQLKKLYTK